MKILFVIFVCFMSISANAMLENINGMYCRIDIEWTNIVTAYLYTANDSVGKKIVDENGKLITFKSDIDAIQYMHDHGWELVSGSFVKSSKYLAYFKRSKMKSD